MSNFNKLDRLGRQIVRLSHIMATLDVFKQKRLMPLFIHLNDRYNQSMKEIA